MKWIFRGMILVLLDWDLALGGRNIGLLPDWLGYWWLAKGFWELEEEWHTFAKGRMPLLFLAVFSAVRYVMDLMVLSAGGKLLRWGLGLIGALAAVLVARLVGNGIRGMEKARDWDLRGDKLQSLWLYLTVMTVLAALLNWLVVVGTVCAVAVAVMAVCYLATLWDSGRRYREYKG